MLYAYKDSHFFPQSFPTKKSNNCDGVQTDLSLIANDSLNISDKLVDQQAIWVYEPFTVVIAHKVSTVKDWRKFLSFLFGP